MTKIAYLCSYVPSELLNKLDFELVPLHKEDIVVKKITTEFPIIMCGYVRQCKRVLDSLDIDGVIFTNCCNAMQRLYDAFRLERPNVFSYMLELPRNNTKEDQNFFKNNITLMTEALCNRFNVTVPSNLSALDVCGAENNSLIVKEKSVFIIGSAISPKLRDFFELSFKPYNTLFNLCSDREGKYQSDSLCQLMPCPRDMTFFNWFSEFLVQNQQNICGIIYLGSQHCDGVLFNFPMIQKECAKFKIPIQNIEVVYRSAGFGQLSTRVEAFIESMEFNASENKEKRATKESLDLNKKKSSYLFKKMMHLVKGVIPQQPLEPIKIIIDYQSEVFSEIAWKNPEKIIWTNMVMPVEIFYAAGLIPVNMELIAGWLASLGLSQRYINKAEAIGFSPNVCSYHKATIGLIEEGGFPIPKAAAISSHICDGSPGVVNYFSTKYDTKTFILNVPFNYTSISLNYLHNQFRKLIEWVESYTGKKIEEAKLKEAIELSNQARHYWEKAFEIRNIKP